MLEILICVGSSCHLKGSYEIVKLFQELVRTRKLQNKVELKASFCLGHCTEGVAIKVDGEWIGGVTASNAGAIFEEKIVGRLENEHNPV